MPRNLRLGSHRVTPVPFLLPTLADETWVAFGHRRGRMVRPAIPEYWVISVGDYIYNYDLYNPILAIIGIIVGLIMLLAGY